MTPMDKYEGPNHWPPDDSGSGDLGEASDPETSGSAEDVRAQLEENDQVLRENGSSPEEYEDPTAELEELAFSISHNLRELGLQDSEEVTADSLTENLSPEVLEKLTSNTAESLFFEVKRYMMKVKMSRVPITPRRLYSKAETLRTLGMDLEKLQLIQRQEAIGYLYWMGLEQSQIMKLLSGKPEEEQTINRLRAYFFLEPKLRKLVRTIHRETSLRVGGPPSPGELPETILIEPIDIEVAVMRAQSVLQKELEEAEKSKQVEMNPATAKTGWDSIAEDVYNDIVHRIDAYINLGNLILTVVRNVKKGPMPDPFEEDSDEDEVA